MRSHLEYSSSVWDPRYKQAIFGSRKTQRKGARFVTLNYSYQDSVASMLEYLRCSPLQQWRKQKTEKTEKTFNILQSKNDLLPIIMPEYVQLFFSPHKNTGPSLCTISNQLRAIQENVIYYTRPRACSICGRLHRSTAELHFLDSTANDV